VLEARTRYHDHDKSSSVERGWGFLLVCWLFLLLLLPYVCFFRWFVARVTKQLFLPPIFSSRTSRNTQRWW
jgi:hypothetical protein